MDHIMRAVAEEVRQNLELHVLRKWYPASVDAINGGFLENFGPEWQSGVNRRRSIVYQSRLTWMAARATQLRPAVDECTGATVSHGMHFLRERMWDEAEGGFHWAVDREGQPLSGGGKHAYGMAFGIYACSEAFRAIADPDALLLAMQAFRWLDAAAHDPVNGGYLEALDRKGQPLLTPPGVRPSDQIGTRYGCKSMNTHIHLLEAYANLYTVWPDPLLRCRLAELLTLVRDRITQPQGYLAKFLLPDWTVQPDLDSYGHDTETAFLLVEASEALSEPDDRQTWNAAKSLVDHALLYGYDHEGGGFYEEGPVGTMCSPTQKVWWEQAEGLNALLLMHERFGESDATYWEAFLSQWRFITKHQIDPINGGWYPAVAADGSEISGQDKSNSWTDPYHQGRALINVAARLEHLAHN